MEPVPWRSLLEAAEPAGRMATSALRMVTADLLVQRMQVTCRCSLPSPVGCSPSSGNLRPLEIAVQHLVERCLVGKDQESLVEPGSAEEAAQAADTMAAAAAFRHTAYPSFAKEQPAVDLAAPALSEEDAWTALAAMDSSMALDETCLGSCCQRPWWPVGTQGKAKLLASAQLAHCSVSGSLPVVLEPAATRGSSPSRPELLAS